jgi:microcin C transport system substrate-binding protein
VRSFFIAFLLLLRNTHAEDLARPSETDNQVGAKTRVSFALVDEPQYPDDFKNLNYVNPNAPKGGIIRYPMFNDNFATFVDNAHVGADGPAEGRDWLHCSMMASAADDPYSRYLYAAKNLEIADDMSYVIFNLNEKVVFNRPGEDKCTKKMDRVRPKHVTAEDVAFSFEMNKKYSAGGSQGRFKGIDSYQVLNGGAALRGVDSYHIISPNRILFRLNKRDKDTILLLGSMDLYSKDFHAQAGHEFDRRDRQNVPGCGPYVLKGAENHSIHYHRACNWWGEKVPSQVGLNNFDEIHYEYYKDTQAQDSAFMNGELDYLLKNGKKEWPPVIMKDRVGPNKQISAYSVDFVGTKPVSSIEFNNETLDDHQVRLAIESLFEKEYLSRGTSYGILPEDSYFRDIRGGIGSKDKVDAVLREIQTAHPDSFPKEAFEETFQPKSAPNDYQAISRERKKHFFSVMKDAGWKLQEDPRLAPKKTWLVDTDPNNLDRKIWMKDGKELPTLRFATASAKSSSNLSFVQNMEGVGIKVKFEQKDATGLQKLIEKKQFDIRDSYVWHPDIPGDETRNRWSSKFADVESSANKTRTRNSSIDDVVERVVTAKTSEDRGVAVGAMDRLLQAEAPSFTTIRTDGKRILMQNRLGHAFPLPEKGESNMWDETPASWWDKSLEKH